MGWGLKRHALTLAIGLVPVAMLLLTWSPEFRPWMWQVKVFSPVMPLVEVAFTLGAILDGLLGTLRQIRLRRRAAIAAATLAAIWVGTIPLAPDPADALIRTGLWFLHVMFGLSLLHFVGSRFDAWSLVRGYLAGAAIFFVLLLMFIVQVWNTNFDWVNGLPAFSHIRHHGFYFIAILTMAVGVVAGSERRRTSAAAFAFMVAILCFTWWTGSRGPILATLGAAIAGAIVLPVMRRPRVWVGLLAALALSWAVAAQLPSPAPHMGTERAVASTTETTKVMTGRPVLWKRVSRAVMERPVFGYGDGQMRHVATFHGSWHPHNVVLQVLLAWGAVGLLCVVILAAHFLRGAIPVVRARASELTPLFMAMLGLATLSLVDGTLYLVLPTSIFAACAGAIGACWLQQRAE